MGIRDDEEGPRRPGVSWSEPVSWDETSPAEPAADPPDEPLGARRPRRWVGSALVVGALLAVVGVGAAVLLRPDRDPAPAPVPVAAMPVPVLPAAPESVPGTCANRIDGQIVYGDGPGGTANGPDAILAFQHAYYGERSGVAARDYATVDGAVPAAEVIQAGIDTIPVGSKHCLAIMPQGADRYLVELTETRPTGEITVYRQIVTTATQDGQTLIVGIAQAPE